MPNANKKVRLDTPSSRRTILPGKKLYIHKLQAGLSLGYRKGLRGGSWYARLHLSGTKYTFEFLALADDTGIHADGERVMTFDQAKKAAENWLGVREAVRKGKRSAKPTTVEDAAKDWLEHFTGSERSKDTSQSNVDYYILPTLGDIELRELTKPEIERWLHAVARMKPKKVVMREVNAEKLSPSRRSKLVYDADDSETIRKRRSTANRIFNDLKAILNRAADNETSLNRNEWESVEKFQEVSVSSQEYLTVKEIPRFYAAAAEDFRKLVQGALITGSRYGELGQLKVQKFKADLQAVFVMQQKSKKEKCVYLTDEEAAFFAEQCKGKKPNDFIFLKADGTPWNKSNQQERMADTLKAAKIDRHVRFHDLRHTTGTLMLMQKTPLQVVSKHLGHSNSRVTEKHYSHIADSYIAEQVRTNKPSMVFTSK